MRHFIYNVIINTPVVRQSSSYMPVKMRHFCLGRLPSFLYIFTLISSMVPELWTLRVMVVPSNIFTKIFRTSRILLEHKENGGLLPNILVRQCAVIIQLFVGKDALLNLRKSLHIFNLSCHIVNGI